MEHSVLRLRICRGSIPRRVLLRFLMISCALSVVPLLQIFAGVDEGALNPVRGDECAVNLSFLGPFLFSGTKLLSSRFLNPILDSFESVQCKENINLTASVVSELIGRKMLSYDAKALCIGQRSASAILALRQLGFSNARGVYKLPFFSLKHRKLVYELDFKDYSFDFAFSRDVDKVAVPAVLVLEAERVLKPGGIGAMLLGTSNGLNSDNLVRSVTPVSSLLKDSRVVHVGHVEGLALVVFKKNLANTAYFDQSLLPADCPSVVNNKPYVDFMEPLFEKKPVDFEEKIHYLPQFVDLSSRKKLVYISLGATKHLNADETSWFFPSYPMDGRSFNVYFVDHNTSVTTSYVNRPGVTFVYHLGLAGTKPRADLEVLERFVEDDSFDFLAWFKATVYDSEFVVLKMNAGEMEQNFLLELFSSGTICFVDELFLRCLNQSDCMGIFKSLRSSGVFVHQWWED